MIKEKGRVKRGVVGGRREEWSEGKERSGQRVKRGVVGG